MSILQKITDGTVAALKSAFDKEVTVDTVSIQETRKDFEGQYTVVCFPFAKLGIGRPEAIGEGIGKYLQENLPEIGGFNVVKGFLNLSLSDAYWRGFFNDLDPETFVRNDYGAGRKVMVEYSSPNTNKPLHLGHLRNCFLGDSICRILEGNGFEVIRTCINNDRGIAVCKSMLMYQRYANGATPESTGKKGDFFVVDYYVRFRDDHEAEVVGALMEKGIDEETANLAVRGKSLAHPDMDKEEKKKAVGLAKKAVKEAGLDMAKLEYDAPVNEAARELLRQWEAGDAETVALWKQMNDWVYDGFNATYDLIGVHFDKHYYESDTYLLGNEMVDFGLEKGVFYQREDGSVWINLEDEGLDEKAVRRSDGTAMYITQDIGTAKVRHDDYDFEKHVYVVGDEQIYHFKVLFLILKKLGWEWYEGMYHLAYGMVDLPSGKMKTREGTSVDADLLVGEVTARAKEVTDEKGKTEGMSEAEQAELNHRIALAALKYFILKVDPKKRMVYDPQESVQLEGDTGPFIQYSYARARSIARKAEVLEARGDALKYTGLAPQEIDLIYQISKFPQASRAAAEGYNPSELATYLYDLAKTYNSFYQAVKVLNDEEPDAMVFRLRLCAVMAGLLKAGLDMLGIEVPEQM